MQHSQDDPFYILRCHSGSKYCTKELKPECICFWARLASFCHLGAISDPLIHVVSKFQIKGQENKIFTIGHFIWVFTGRQSICSGISGLQKVNRSANEIEVLIAPALNPQILDTPVLMQFQCFGLCHTLPPYVVFVRSEDRRECVCTGSSEPSLIANAISTESSAHINLCLKDTFIFHTQGVKALIFS